MYNIIAKSTQARQSYVRGAEGATLPRNVQGPVPRKMVKFNPGLSQILSKVFLYKNV